MSTQPTNLPVPSESPRDLKFNAGKIDEFVTSFAEWYVDRFGNNHYTIEGLKQLALQQIYNLGWNLAGTFQGGAVVSAAGDIIQDTTTGVWYRWDDLGSLPKTVPSGSTPASSGGTGEGKWQPVEITDVLRKDLAKASGAGLSGFNPLSSYPPNTLGDYLAQVPGSDNTGVNNSLDSFNAAIQKLALAGGGIIHPEPGVYLISGGSVLLPSYITLDLRGCELKGDGSNTLIASGAIVGGVLIDITPEYGTGGGDGNGTHFVSCGIITGGKLDNAAIGIRAHRFNYGSTISNVTFLPALTNSYISSHSWGLEVHQNTIWSPAVMKDFVDWTEISGNSFEGPGWSVRDNYVALTITTGGYGGSYSARIVNNGFHNMATAIALSCEIDNLVIESNHFERTIYHVNGNSNLKYNLSIKNNWMKANLDDAGISKPPVIPMVFGSLINSKIGPNRFTTHQSTYGAYIVAKTNDCYGNEYIHGYAISSENDFSKIQMNEPNSILIYRGSNDALVSQPAYELLSGSGNYTLEKYKSNYHDVSNSIPFCNVSYSGGDIYIDTWFSWSKQSLCAFKFKIDGTYSAIIAGTFCYDSIATTINKSSGTVASLPIAVSNYNGVTRLSISQAPNGGVITGWVKEL